MVTHIPGTKATCEVSCGSIHGRTLATPRSDRICPVPGVTSNSTRRCQAGKLEFSAAGVAGWCFRAASSFPSELTRSAALGEQCLLRTVAEREANWRTSMGKAVCSVDKRVRPMSQWGGALGLTSPTMVSGRRAACSVVDPWLHEYARQYAQRGFLDNCGVRVCEFFRPRSHAICMCE